MNVNNANNAGTSNSLLIRLDKLERQNRIGKIVIAVCTLFLFSAAMAPQRGSNPGTIVTANQIAFVRSDGRLFAKLAVDERRNELAISGEDGSQRLWISGLAGLNSPPFTGLTLADPKGAMRVYLTAA